MPNIFTGSVSASAPSNTLVGVASGQVVALNTSRVGLALVNISTSTIYLGLDGNAAVLNSGITLSPNNGAWTMTEYDFTIGQINAIGHSAGNILAIQEFTR